MTARTLPELAERLLAYGDRPFLGHAEDTLSAAVTVERAHALAQRVLALELPPGAKVAIYLEKRLEKALWILACGLAGVVSVIVNPRLKDAQVAHVLDDCEAAVVVTSTDKRLLLVDPDATLRARHVILVDSPDSAPRSARPLPHVSPGDPATLLYTSGSTGAPKGIVQSHASLCDGARIVAGYLRLSAADHVLAVLPLSFDYGLNQLLAAAWVGARVTLHSYFTITDLGAELVRTKATGLAGVPTLWVAFCAALRAGALAPDSLRELRYVTNSGGRLGRSEIRILREALPRVQVYSMYGLTEAFRSTFLPPEEIDRLPGSIGKAIPEVEVLVIDPVSGKECAPGQVGELVHAGALIADGYWRRPEDTARVFRADPRGHGRGTVVYSGDLVTRDAEGFLWYVGRRDKQLKVQGYRVSPEEVERELEKCSGVAKACVFGVPDPKVGHRLIAGIQPVRAGDTGLATKVLQVLRSALPAWLVPAELHSVDALPLNQNGKPDARALEADLRARGVLAAGIEPDAAP